MTAKAKFFKKKAVVLLSGGMDSAVTLYLAQRAGFRCLCLIFDYRQLHRKEIASAKKIAGTAKAEYRLIKLDFPWKGSALLDRDMKIRRTISASEGIPATYVPARNLIFLSHALSCAEATHASAIYIGAHAQDYSGYPDCRPEFFRAFQKAADCGTKTGVFNKRIRIVAPLLNKSKAEIIRLGLELCVPFELTWSCYRGKRLPCGRCDSCRYRAKGFSEAGLGDPLLRA